MTHCPMSSRLHRTYLAVCVLLLAVEGRSRAARGWPCLYREKIGVGRRACLYRESRALRLRMSGGCGEDSAYSVSAPEYEGPKLPKADDSAPPPRSILKVSDDGEIWVDREGQEHDDSLCDAGRERKVVETYDLGPDVLCSCESCTGNINGDHQPAGCVRTTKRRGEGWDRQSGDFARPEIAGKGMQDLRAQGSGFASSAAGQAEVHLSGSVQGKGCEVTEVQQMGEGNGCEPVEWEDDSRGAPSADLSDGDFGFGDSLDFHDDGIAKTPDTSGQRCPEGPSISEQLNHTAERAGDKQSPSQDFGIRSESSWPPGLDSGSFGSFAAPTKTDSDFMWAMRMGDEEAAADARSRGASRQALDDQLLEAAKEGDIARLRLAIRLGGDVDGYDSRGPRFTALHWAAIKGRDAVIPMLVEAGAFVDQPGLMGVTPLQLAVIHASPAAVAVLLEAGANMHVENEQRMSAMMLASSLKQGAESLPLLQAHA